MTVPSTVSRDDYVGNGAASVYAYNYRILANTDLLVTVRDLANVETTLVLTTDYTVDGVGDASGGNITLVNSLQAWLDADGDLLTSFALTIRRVRPVTQTTDIRNQGPYAPEDIEDSLDHGVMLHQQRQDEVDRSLKLPETEVGTAAKTTIPVSADRASKVLAFNAAGEPIAQTNVPASAVPATAFMETLLDDTDAAEARATLGVFSVPDGILEGTIGRQVSADDTVRTIGLVLAKSGIRTVVANQNLTVTANASGDPRVDLIEWNGTALSVLAGTPAAIPASPSPTSGRIPIATIYVPDSFSTVLSMGVASASEAHIIAYYHAFGGLFATRLTSVQVVAADALGLILVASRVPVYLPSVKYGWVMKVRVLIENVSAVAKTTLQVFHRLDSVTTGPSGPRTTMTPDDSGETELYDLSYEDVMSTAAPITLGPHLFDASVLSNGNSTNVKESQIILREIR